MAVWIKWVICKHLKQCVGVPDWLSIEHENLDLGGHEFKPHIAHGAKTKKKSVAGDKPSESFNYSSS